MYLSRNMLCPCVYGCVCDFFSVHCILHLVLFFHFTVHLGDCSVSGQLPLSSKWLRENLESTYSKLLIFQRRKKLSPVDIKITG